MFELLVKGRDIFAAAHQTNHHKFRNDEQGRDIRLCETMSLDSSPSNPAEASFIQPSQWHID